jgi:hypothetical protein
LKTAVYDELHSGSGGTIGAARTGLSREKEASYQQRIMDLENQVHYTLDIQVATWSSTRTGQPSSAVLRRELDWAQRLQQQHPSAFTAVSVLMMMFDVQLRF